MAKAPLSKQCRDCGEVKPAGEFWRRKQSPDGSHRHYWHREKYGIGEDDVQRIIMVQRGLCPICCDAPAEHVDHCHQTRAIREVLCPACNTGMGQVKDDPAILHSAADYLGRTPFP